MVISQPHLDAIVEHCLTGFPNEACGLVATRQGRSMAIYPLESVDPSPVFYHIDPQEQLRAMLEIDDREWELGAIFHSHTRTRAYPSETDIKLAHYPDALYIIVSLADDEKPDVRAFRIVEGQVGEETLEIEG